MWIRLKGVNKDQMTKLMNDKEMICAKAEMHESYDYPGLYDIDILTGEVIEIRKHKVGPFSEWWISGNEWYKVIQGDINEVVIVSERN